MSVGAPLTVGSARSTRETLVAAWAVVLLASSLPQAVGRARLGRPVSADQRALLALAVIGVGLLAFFVWGWILARSMVETRGMFWAWLVHFWQDVLIFSFLAVGAVTSGG